MKHISFTKFLVGLCFLFVCSFAVQAQDDVPPNPEYGKCYQKCRIPDQYETITEQVLVREESKKIMTTPAQYETQTEQVLAKEASTKIVPVPAVYETVTEQVLSKPAASKLVEVPAVYETVTERIQTAPESGKFVSKRAENCMSSNPEDCQVMCWVKVPAQFKTVTKQILKTPATTQEIEIPAEYQTVSRQVVKTPATTQTIEIPAEYKTLTKRVLVSPASKTENVIPAEYKTITKTQLVQKGGSTEWQEVVCQANITNSLMRSVQSVLSNAGYYSGAIDGINGSGTKSALAKYQEANGLPIGGLNAATIAHMGL